MVMKHKTLRPAIAMLELIFALVIMGIVMMSAPMLISTASQSTNVALQQEGINEAAARVHMIMGYPWDENNVENNYRPPILNVTNGDGAFVNVGTTQRRVGIPLESQRTFIRIDSNSTSNLDASSLQSDGGDADDIDDFSGNITLNFITDATDDNDIDYVEKTTVNINTAIAYSSDSVSGGYNQGTITYVPFSSDTPTTNIKMITVTLTSTDTTNADILGKTIILRAFSSNIGGYTFEEKGF